MKTHTLAGMLFAITSLPHALASGAAVAQPRPMPPNSVGPVTEFSGPHSVPGDRRECLDRGIQPVAKGAWTWVCVPSSTSATSGEWRAYEVSSFMCHRKDGGVYNKPMITAVANTNIPCNKKNYDDTNSMWKQVNGGTDVPQATSYIPIETATATPAPGMPDPRQPPQTPANGTPATGTPSTGTPAQTTGLPDKPWKFFTPQKDGSEVYEYEDGSKATRYPDGRIVVIPAAVVAPAEPVKPAQDTPPNNTAPDTTPAPPTRERSAMPAPLPRGLNGKPVIDLPLGEEPPPASKPKSVGYLVPAIPATMKTIRTVRLPGHEAMARPPVKRHVERLALVRHAAPVHRALRHHIGMQPSSRGRNLRESGMNPRETGMRNHAARPRFAMRAPMESMRGVSRGHAAARFMPAMGGARAFAPSMRNARAFAPAMGHGMRAGGFGGQRMGGFGGGFGGLRLR